MLAFCFVSQPVFSGDGISEKADLIELSDYYFHEKWEPEKALALLYEAKANYPNNDEILWRISRSYIAVAEKSLHSSESEEDDNSVESYYETAREYADRAITINPEHSMAYTQRAIAAAQLGIYRWVGSAIGLVNDTYEDAEKAIELDKSNDTAHFVYARTHAEVIQRVPWGLRRLLGFSWADMDTALHHFDKAMEINPEFIMYRLYAAKAFLKGDKKDRAYTLLKTVSELEKQTFFDSMYRKEASELMDEIKNRLQ